MLVDEATLGRLKQGISFATLLPELGFDPPRRLQSHKGRLRCVIHGGDNPTAFEFNEQTGLFKCYGCHRHGNKIQLVQSALRLTFPQAVQWLADRTGISLTTGSRVERQQFAVVRQAVAPEAKRIVVWRYLVECDLQEELSLLLKYYYRYPELEQAATRYAARQMPEPREDDAVFQLAWEYLSGSARQKLTAKIRTLRQQIEDWNALRPDDCWTAWEALQADATARSYWDDRIAEELAAQDAVKATLWESLQPLAEAA